MATISTSMTFSNIRNPPSLKQTSTFKIYVRGSTGSIINYIQSGVTITMNTSATVSSYSVSPNSLTVGDITPYTLTISHSIPIHTANDYAIITIPSLMSLPSSLSCTALSGISSVNCLPVSNTVFKIIYTSSPSSTTIQVSILNITNYLIGDQSVSYSLSIYDSLDYLM